MDLPAWARSRFGRHLARGAGAGGTGRAKVRTRSRAARDCRAAPGRVRALSGACAHLPAICFALRLRIGLSLKAAENEIILSYRYGTRCGAFQWTSAKVLWDIVSFYSRRLTWIAMDIVRI